MLSNRENEQMTLLLTDEKMGEQEKMRKAAHETWETKGKRGKKGMSHMIDLLSPHTSRCAVHTPAFLALSLIRHFLFYFK